MERHENLKIWEKSFQLALKVYKHTKQFPKEELYGLTSQLRRAAMSIPANIAEGASRNSKKEFQQFLYIARGSLAELETFLRLAKELSYLQEIFYADLRTEAEEVARMLNAFLSSMKKGLLSNSSLLSLAITFLFLSFATTFPLLPFLSFVPNVHSAAFDLMGLGARSLGMGSAFVSVPEDYESVVWNPAGIARLPKKTFYTTYRNPYNLGMLRYVGAGFALPNIGKGTIGFSLLRLDTVGDAGSLDYSENTLVFSYATYLMDPLFLGINGKYYRVNSSVGAAGMGLDFGLNYVVRQPWMCVGLAIQDLNRPVLTWDSGAKDRLPLRLRVGMSGKIFSHTLVSGQFSWQDQEESSHRNHVGIEQKLFRECFALRLGVNERDNLWRFSWGFGLRIKSFEFDYGWERENLLGDTQVFSLSAKF